MPPLLFNLTFLVTLSTGNCTTPPAACRRWAGTTGSWGNNIVLIFFAFLSFLVLPTSAGSSLRWAGAAPAKVVFVLLARIVLPASARNGRHWAGAPAARGGVVLPFLFVLFAFLVLLVLLRVEHRPAGQGSSGTGGAGGPKIGRAAVTTI